VEYVSDAVIELQMPQMGESVTEGTILEWHVSEGQEVAEGDTVVEVSTDKIDAEVPAPASGVVTKLLAAVDDVVEVGQTLAQIDPNGTATNGGDPSPLHEADEATGLVMGGGEGDEDLGEDDVPADSSQPGVIETPVAQAAADPAAPGGEAEEAGGTFGFCMSSTGTTISRSISLRTPALTISHSR
jgi:pyruvate/2-oxoglutarate dehydrogenase complex dihydrolipoamide acyltransferase (E2) component